MGDNRMGEGDLEAFGHRVPILVPYATINQEAFSAFSREAFAVSIHEASNLDAITTQDVSSQGAYQEEIIHLETA